MTQLPERYKRGLSKWLDCSPTHLFLYWKGRVALYALLKGMEIGEGDEVIMPAFTCVVVPNAVLYTGAHPVYVDIDPETLNPSFEQIKTAVTDRTRVILCQNTFGLSSDLDRIVSWARERGIVTIEDCTHGFGGSFQGKPNGTWCDAAFFSTQWNKPFSTGLGGFSLVSDEALREKVYQVNRSLQPPAWRESIMLRILITLKERFLSPTTYWKALRAYRWLSRAGLVTGSSSGKELESPAMPEGYFKGMAKAQMREGMKKLRGLEEVLQRRKKNGEIYTRTLEQLGKWAVAPALFPDHAFLKYPVLVRDKEAFRQAAEDQQIELGDWFCSPLHPVDGDLSPWKMEREAYPVASQAAAHILDLPTDENDSLRVARFLEDQSALLLPPNALTV